MYWYFRSGSEIGLEINRALRDSTYFTLFGASSVNHHGKYAYKNYVAGIPLIDAPKRQELIFCKEAAAE